jgi:DNA (cytosine-5)-methyltransferase 1
VIANDRKPLRFLSVCSGIEAASQALHHHRFECAAVSEIEPHPCAVLAHRFGASRPWNMPHPDDVPTRNADGSHRFPQAIAKDRRERAAAIKAVANLPVEGEIPNFGDMSRFQEWPDADYDALFGGTPCQSFSVAGLRAGLDDPRGNLMLTFGAIAARFRPRWVTWENVPGVLSSNDGRDFASFLGLLSGRSITPPAEGWQNSGIVPGIADAYGLAWRVLDAQHSRTLRFRRAVPQRRRRVFVVGYIGDWRRAAAVLFDAESLRRDPPPSRSAGERVASTISARPTGGGGLGTDFDLEGGVICAEVSTSLDASMGRLQGASGQDANHGHSTLVVFGGNNTEGPINVATALLLHESPRQDFESDTFLVQAVAPTLRGRGFDATDDGTGKGTPIIPVCFDSKGSQVQTDETGAAPTLRAMTHADSHQNGGGQLAVAFQPRFVRNGRGAPDEVAAPLTAEAGRTGKGDSAQVVAYSIQAGALRENPEAGPDGVGVQEGHAYTLEARAEVQAIAFAQNQRDEVREMAVAGALASEPGMKQQTYLATPWAVRRLTPVECERLMGMEDGFTNIPWRGKDFSPDGNRYKELGNSWALNSIDWIGERMAIVDTWD